MPPTFTPTVAIAVRGQSAVAMTVELCWVLTVIYLEGTIQRQSLHFEY